MKRFQLAGILLGSLVPSLLWAFGGSVPAGLPQDFVLGVANGNPNTLDWVAQTRSQSGSCWDFHYQYLTGGVNTGNGWEAWNQPTGQFAANFMTAAQQQSLIPVFTYYELVPSSPDAYNESRNLQKLQNAGLMQAYFANYKMMLDRIRAFDRPVIVHLEPDLWGFLHASVFQGSNDPAQIPVQVAGSGSALVAGFANNVAGFSQALIALRDTYAPKAILAFHWSHWANNDLMHCTGCNQATIEAELAKHVEFYNRLMQPRRWDLFFSDPDDRDADFHYVRTGGQDRRWVSRTATNIGGNPATYARLRFLLNGLSEGLGLRSMLWQLPLGNSYFRTCNNSSGHFRDNLVESILPPVSAYNGPQHADSAIGRFAAAGVIGLLFGSGLEDANPTTTHFTDLRGDGVTNPQSNTAGDPDHSVWGQATSAHADDDGGYLRLGSAAYCAAGRYPLPGNNPDPETLALPASWLLTLAVALLCARKPRK